MSESTEESTALLKNPADVLPPPVYQENQHHYPYGNHVPKVVVTNQPIGGYNAPPLINTTPNNSWLWVTLFILAGCATFGSFLTLCCTIPAIIFAIKARDADMLHREEERQSNVNFTVGCNCCAVISGAVILGLYLYYYFGYHHHQNNYN